MDGSAGELIQWCRNPEQEHGRPRTGPDREGAGPNGGQDGGHVEGAGGDVTPTVGLTAGPDRVPQADDREAGSSDRFPATQSSHPSATLDCTGTEVQTGLAPVPTSRVRPARMQPAFAPIPTPRAGAAGARQGPAPVPAPQRRAAEQPTGPPPAHTCHQPELEDEARKGPAKPEELSLYIICVKT